MRNPLLLAIGMLVALLASAAPALAGTITYDGGVLVVTGGDNLNHEVQLRTNAGGDEIIDTQSFTSVPGDCTPAAPTTSTVCPPHFDVRVVLGSGNDKVFIDQDCFDSYDIRLGDGSNSNTFDETCPDPATGTVTAGSGQDTLNAGSASTVLTISGGDGGDTIRSEDGSDILHGGEGPDLMYGALGNDQVFAEGGDDALRGGDGNDVEDGGPGNDSIGFTPTFTSPRDPDPGADVIVGGDGVDVLSLDGHTAAVTLTLDGQANDGTAGEGDNIGSDIETIIGTAANDNFTGSAGPDGFDGAGGGDVIHGAAGDDHIDGGSGDDQVFGDTGIDRVQGTYGADVVDGGPGTDDLYGDIAGCSVFCSPANDVVLARDGERDTVDCGGAGSATVDQLDVVGFCTTIDRSGVVPPDATVPDTKISNVKVKSKKRKATFQFEAIGQSTGFLCALAGKHQEFKFTSCVSPTSYKHLRRGKYSFAVSATAGGGPDLSPAVTKIKIG
jgi:Ca2+-binding RTX toxin-like protein